jgi:hypothetical protein
MITGTVLLILPPGQRIRRTVPVIIAIIASHPMMAIVDDSR